MAELSVAPLSTAIREAGTLQVADKFTNLSRHASPLLLLFFNYIMIAKFATRRISSLSHFRAEAGTLILTNLR
jgi:hypothetical protein